ncbi:MAG: hypothetical protein MR836_08920 [Ruminococcus sp.]|nr:hypothetical protein [Ruminococcus sp.]
MANKRKISDRKYSKPKLRFHFGILILIFVLSFSACFALYMFSANMDDNFFEKQENKGKSTVEKSQNISEDESAAGSESSEESLSTTGVSNPVPESDAKDEAYLKECVLVADSTLFSTASNGRIKTVIGNDVLNASNVNTEKIKSSNGTITAFEILKVKQPSDIYVMLGSDLGTSSVDSMISSVSTFIGNVIGSLPDASIYLMQLPPIYTDSKTLTNDMINSYNSKLLALANSCGVYCIDTNTILKSNAGSLDENYYLEKSGVINSAAYDVLCDYILTHTAE